MVDAGWATAPAQHLLSGDKMQGVYFQISEEEAARMKARCHSLGVYQGRVMRALMLLWVNGVIDKVAPGFVESRSRLKQGRHGRGWTVEDMEKAKEESHGGG
jgi:hypothetical protein